MTIDTRVLAAVLFVLGSGCTTPNPRSCEDGTCTDPAYPFCDVDGSLQGAPKTCVAVSCTPGEVAQCRGDVAVTCNAEGTSYDSTQCERGCDATLAGGCRLCEPNQTVCANGAVQTCDAAGNVASSESCPLGCFEDQPRCREVAPSNNLGMYLDLVESPPDIDLANAEIDPTTGTVTAAGVPVAIPSFLAPPSGSGAAIRIYVVRSLKLTSAMIRKSVVSGNDPVGPAVAFVSRGDISIRGEVLVSSVAGSAVAGCRPADGGRWESYAASGGGGGGNATPGADGGAVISLFAGGTGDFTSGTSILVPLRGGCSGGDPGLAAPRDLNGGGALQLTSRTNIEINATIDVRGHDGSYWQSQDFPTACSGGGAGGGVLVEAPQVTLGPDAKLLAGGGNGFTLCPGPNCGSAGIGATRTSTATKGGDVANGAGVTAGGGGGGLGRIRINTASSAYTKDSSAIEDGQLTTGMIDSR